MNLPPSRLRLAATIPLVTMVMALVPMSVLPIHTASAQPAKTAQPTPSTSRTDTQRTLSIQGISGAIAQDQPLSLQLDIGPGQAVNDPRITVALREPVETRTELVNAVINQNPGWVFSSSSQRIAPIAPNQPATVAIQKTIAELYLDHHDTGVYPLDISLLDGNKRIARTVGVLDVNPTPSTPVPVAIVGGLGQTTQSVVVNADDDLPTQTQEVVFTPAFDADVVGLTETNQINLLNRTIQEGLRARKDQTNAPVAPILALTQPINRATASAITLNTEVKGLLVPQHTLVSPGSIQQFNNTTVMAGDPVLTDAAKALSGQALTQLVQAYVRLPEANPTDTGEEETGQSDQSAANLGPEPIIADLRPIADANDQQTISEALIGTPGIVVKRLDELLTIPVPPTRRAVFETPSLSAGRRAYFEELKAIHETLPSLLAMTKDRRFDDGTQPSRFEDSLLAATSIHGEDRAVLARIKAHSEEIDQAIHVLSPPPITITGEKGSIPITVINDSSIPLDVRARVISSNLLVDGNDFVTMRLRPHDATTQDVTVSPRTSGGLTSAIIQVENPLTKQVITTGTISVRSTAYPYTALLFAAGAVAVLMMWGWRNRPNRFRSTPRTPDDTDSTGEIATTQDLEVTLPLADPDSTQRLESTQEKDR